MPTPRESIEQTRTAQASTDNIPLLPVSSQNTQTATPNGPSLSRPRSASPFPASGTVDQRAAFGNAPRMWQGGIDGTGETKRERDLTNTKLAKNQLVSNDSRNKSHQALTVEIGSL